MSYVSKKFFLFMVNPNKAKTNKPKLNQRKQNRISRIPKPSFLTSGKRITAHKAEYPA